MHTYEMLHQESNHWAAHVGSVPCSEPEVDLQVLVFNLTLQSQCLNDAWEGILFLEHHGNLL